MTAALLLALATAVLLAPRTTGRLTAVLPQSLPPPMRLAPRWVGAACALAGLAVWALVGGAVGAGLGAAAAVVGPRLLSRLSDEESDEAELVAVLPLALDLLGAVLAGGAAPVDGVLAVARAFPGPCGDRLTRVGSALALGARPAEAWRALGDGRDPAGAAARALARAAEGGAPVAAAVQRVAAEARRRAAADGHRRAARAGVLAVLPLGVCFLPAFVLLGVVPAVLGLAGPLLHSLA